MRIIFDQVITQLRQEHGMTQDELAEKLFVTRQAVSRWEHGETMPGPETLLQLSRLFHVSVNSLLGSPYQLICQSCGMPLVDELLGTDADGTLNEEYCRWCWQDGKYLTECSMEEMADTCVPHMGWDDPQEAKRFMLRPLPGLKRWRQTEE